MLEVFTKIESIQQRWGEIKMPDFLHINFLHTYYEKHNQIKHLFILGKNMRLYAHIFNLTFNNTKNYLKNNSITNIFISLINFDVLYITNSFITNVPAFISDKSINLKQLLYSIKHNYSIIVIPDFLFDKMVVEDYHYSKIEVEEEMVLDLRKEWSGFEDYSSDLKKKYRKKLKQIIKKTCDLKIRNLDVDELKVYANDIKKLFNQVAKSSQFRGPEFNTDSYMSFVKQDFMNVYGFFYHDKLVGFSSIIKKEKVLYSYFVGFDKSLNKLFPLYGRILVENINTAIKLKKERIILGRTANEYKSNFGAYPIKSYVYLKIKNKFLRAILKPVYSKLRIKEWIQRHPFKDRCIET
jgi:hypothetical protein